LFLLSLGTRKHTLCVAKIALNFVILARLQMVPTLFCFETSRKTARSFAAISGRSVALSMSGTAQQFLVSTVQDNRGRWRWVRCPREVSVPSVGQTVRQRATKVPEIAPAETAVGVENVASLVLLPDGPRFEARLE
jgi:hypothetical protein